MTASIVRCVDASPRLVVRPGNFSGVILSSSNEITPDVLCGFIAYRGKRRVMVRWNDGDRQFEQNASVYWSGAVAYAQLSFGDRLCYLLIVTGKPEDHLYGAVCVLRLTKDYADLLRREYGKATAATALVAIERAYAPHARRLRAAS